MIRMRRIGLVLGVLASTAAMLGGCNNVSKAKYDAAVQEASDLRERNSQLDQSNRDKDARIAELESKNASQPTGGNFGGPAGYNPPPATEPASRVGKNSGWQNDEDFKNDNGRMVAEIAGDVLFDPGQAVVKASAKKQLDRIAKKLNGTFAGATIRIEGHTDWDPIKRSKWASNEALSEARAEAVKKYLASKGVSNNRLQTVGMGATHRKSTKAASRRVEIVVMAN